MLFVALAALLLAKPANKMSKENTGREFIRPVFFYTNNDCNILYPDYSSLELCRFDDDSLYVQFNTYYSDQVEFFGKAVDLPEEVIAILSLANAEKMVE